MLNIRRQGDLLFKLIEHEIPVIANEMPGDVVALGETTNHKHKCTGGSVQLYADLEHPEQVGFIDVKEATTLKHEEHNPIELPKGKYAVVHEREYNPFATEANRIRQVTD